MRARVFFLVVMSLLSCSCGRNVSRLLSDVESYMSERPDSALAVLRSVPDEALCRKALKARHALLHSQMLDKNRIEVISDSIITPAVEYYSLHGGAEERVKTSSPPAYILMSILGICRPTRARSSGWKGRGATR